MKPRIRSCLLLMLMLTAGGCEKELARPSEPTGDVAITNVSVPVTCVQGDTVPVVVTVENRGDQEHTLEVILTDTTDGREIARKPVKLSTAGDRGLDGVADQVFTGETDGKQIFGGWLAVGDTNADGFDDLLVSAHTYNNRQGRAYLYLGGKDMDNNADRVFTGENIGDRLGEGGGYLADLNNDGFDDVIIGATGFNNNKGRVYIYRGGLNWQETADVIIDGEVANSSFGYGIAVGDVNGDGHKDLIVGAPEFEDVKGRAYLFYGGDPFDTVADKRFTGENAEDTFSHQMTARGDVDGDGCDDLLIGTHQYPGKSRRGRAYLYYGAPGTEMGEACDIVFDGENDRDDFAGGVDLFDIDDDGYADVLLSAGWWPSGTRQGRAFLYWGGSRKVMDNRADLYFSGEVDALASFGFGCITAGYVNGDKYGDIVVPACDYYRSSKHGRVYLFCGGRKHSMDNTCDYMLTGEAPKSSPFRVRVADFNGDGYGDIVMGGWLFNDSQGRCWLWYGSPPASTDITFNWDTANAFQGKHILKATIDPIEGEDYTTDNTMTVTIDVKEPSK